MSATMTTDECFNEMAKVLGFPKPDETGYIAILEKVKELTEQLKLSEEKVNELTHQNDDYDDLIPDGVECETFAWIEDRLAKMDVMEEVKDDLENKVLHLENEIEVLQKKIDDMESEVLDGDAFLCGVQKQTEQVYYHGEPLMCIEDGTPITISDVFPNKYRVQGSKVDMEAFNKLKVDGMIPWVKDLNGKKVAIPSEELCGKMFGVSREDFSMIVKNSVFDYSDSQSK